MDNYLSKSYIQLVTKILAVLKKGEWLNIFITLYTFEETQLFINKQHAWQKCGYLFALPFHNKAVHVPFYKENNENNHCIRICLLDVTWYSTSRDHN